MTCAIDWGRCSLIGLLVVLSVVVVLVLLLFSFPVVGGGCASPLVLCSLLQLSVSGSPTYSDIYQRSYWYNWLFWWWALGWSKYVENLNKQIWEKKLCFKLVIYKDCYKMNGQQNIKFFLFSLPFQFGPVFHPTSYPVGNAALSQGKEGRVWRWTHTPI